MYYSISERTYRDYRVTSSDFSKPVQCHSCRNRIRYTQEHELHDKPTVYKIITYFYNVNVSQHEFYNLGFNDYGVKYNTGDLILRKDPTL